MNRGQRRAQWRARRAAPVPASPAPVAINLRVGELSLQGFDGNYARRIADSLQHSLLGMLTSQGLPEAWSRSSRAARANGGVLRLTSGASPRAIGEELARRVLAPK
jgi:hypothetical protein